jgi:PAS domain S-box-containing protein
MPGDSDVVRVLHVEEEPEFAELSRTLLERQDDRFEVETATSAAAGRERLVEGDFDCVVADYDVPGENGLEFLEAVREEYPNLPFVPFAGEGSEEVASEANAAGVSDHLQKRPGTERYELLAARILNHVERTRARRDRLESESHSPNAQAIADLGSWRFDPEEWELTCSEASTRIFGTPTDWQPEPREMFDYAHPDDRERLEDAWHAALEGQEFDVEHRIVTEGGETRWVRQRAEFEFDADGEPVDATGVVHDVTDRHELEPRRRAERDRREALFQNPSDAIVEVGRHDGEAVIADANERFSELFGFDHEDVVGERLADVLVPPDGETSERHDEIARKAAGGEHLEAEVRRETRDGVRDFRLNVFPVDATDGEVAGYAIYTDITESKEKQRKLEEYRTLVETVGDAMYILDEEGRVRMANEAMFEYLETDESKLVGSSIADYMLDADYERAAECIQTLLEAEDRQWASLEITAVTESGGRFPGEAIVSVLTDDDGEYRGSVGVARDVSHRIARENELKRYETMVKTAGDMVYILDDQGRFQFVNEAACRLTGYPEEQLVGEHVIEIMDEDAVERGREIIRGLLADGTETVTDSYEWRLERADGDTLPVESHISLLYRDGGEFEGTVGVVRDVSERKAREEQLENFTSVVSHDLRNPLNIAAGRLELAREECESDHLDRAGEALERMETLISELLELARMGSQIDELEPVDFRVLVERGWRGVATADATLEVDAEGRVMADPTRLRQLLENLVRNAVEHGGDDVTVRVGRLDGEPGFFVADDGTGLPADVDTDALFQSSYSTTTEGNGFGLSIVESIADAHGWEVRARDGLDGGARFEFTGVEFAS